MARMVPALPTSVLQARLQRARTVMAETGVDTLLLSVGSDLPYLTGYEAMPLERLTMLVVPLVSCGARLPIYALLIPAFFPPAWHAPVLWLIYLIGLSSA